MPIAAIDPSLSNTAVCIGDATHYDIRSFPSKPRGKLLRLRMSRYLDLADKISSYISDVPGIARVYIEGYSHGSKYNSEPLAEFGGILRMKLLDIAPTSEVAPTSLKKFVTGKGNADKVAVASALARRYRVNLKNADEYDAFGLFQLGLVVSGMRKAKNEKEKEAAKIVAF